MKQKGTPRAANCKKARETRMSKDFSQSRYKIRNPTDTSEEIVASIFKAASATNGDVDALNAFFVSTSKLSTTPVVHLDGGAVQYNLSDSTNPVLKTLCAQIKPLLLGEANALLGDMLGGSEQIPPEMEMTQIRVSP